MTPEPTPDAPRPDDFNVAQVWLDTLSRGACDEEAFLRAVQVLTQRSPEAGWDTLSLIDQYYRRGKISPEAFRRLKTQLGSQLLGPAMQLEKSIPLPRKANATAAPAKTAPIPVAPPAAAPAPKPAAPAVKAAAPTPKPAVPVPPPEAPAIADAVAAAAVSAPVPSVPVLSVQATNPTPITSARAFDSARRTPREVVVGDVLRGRYVIKSVIGRGGTGTVFEAIDRYRLDMEGAGQRLALKVLDAKTSEQYALFTDLRREFQLLQSLSHPNIVRAHEYDRDGDAAFFTMEYLSGLALAGVLAARHAAPLERPHALAVVRDVAAALAHAHARGIVHGDLSPGNVFITNDGEVRVLDFGTARVPTPGSIVIDSAWQTIAAPQFASCQVLAGEPPDVRDDLYSFACVIYVLLSGKHPFADQSADQARAQRLKPARPADLSSAQWRALKSGLAFDRDRRPSDIAGWLKDFDLSSAAPRLPVLLGLVRVSPQPRRAVWVPVLCGLVFAVAVAGWWANGHPDALKRGTDETSSLLHRATTNLRELLAGPSTPAQPTIPAASVEPSPAPAPSTIASPQPVQRSIAAAPPTVQSPVPTPATPPAPARASAPRPNLAPTAAAPARAPSAAPLHTRLELAADTVDAALGEPAARIVVRRSGSLRGEVTFSWWTESGTAKPGQDFMAVAAHEEHIEDGKNFVSLYVPVVADATRHQSKSFYVVINDPSEGATLGRTLTMVTIPSSTD